MQNHIRTNESAIRKHENNDFLFSGKIVVSGGHPGAVLDTEVLNLATNTWTYATPKPLKQWYGTNLAFGTSGIMFVGGASTGQTTEINEYQIDTDTWTLRSEVLPVKRKNMAGIWVPNGKITC